MTPNPPSPPSRRQFLACATAAISALGAATGCTLTAPPPPAAAPTLTGYIDAHSHVWPSDTARFPLARWATG
ncbi:MAG: hypothetical protein ACAI43_10815, partial [Phycisphaerae bacterium]